MSDPPEDCKAAKASSSKASPASKSAWSQAEANDLALFALSLMPSKLSQKDYKAFAQYIGRSEEGVKTFWSRKIAPQIKQMAASVEAASKASP